MRSRGLIGATIFKFMALVREAYNSRYRSSGIATKDVCMCMCVGVGVLEGRNPGIEGKRGQAKLLAPTTQTKFSFKLLRTNAPERKLRSVGGVWGAPLIYYVRYVGRHGPTSDYLSRTAGMVVRSKEGVMGQRLKTSTRNNSIICSRSGRGPKRHRSVHVPCFPLTSFLRTTVHPCVIGKKNTGA